MDAKGISQARFLGRAVILDCVSVNHSLTTYSKMRKNRSSAGPCVGCRATRNLVTMNEVMAHLRVNSLGEVPDSEVKLHVKYGR